MKVQRYKPAIKTLKKLVLTEISDDLFRAHFMERKDKSEVWKDTWKFEGSSSRVRSMLSTLDFL